MEGVASCSLQAASRGREGPAPPLDFLLQGLSGGRLRASASTQPDPSDLTLDPTVSTRPAHPSWAQAGLAAPTPWPVLAEGAALCAQSTLFPRSCCPSAWTSAPWSVRTTPARPGPSLGTSLGVLCPGVSLGGRGLPGGRPRPSASSGLGCTHGELSASLPLLLLSTAQD